MVKLNLNQTITLKCFLEGEEGSFPVDINDTMTMSASQKLIKDMKRHTPATIDPNILALYKVNLDENEEIILKNEFEAIAKRESRVPKLRPEYKLSKYFGVPNRPAEGMVHALVIRPEGECYSGALAVTFIADANSSGERTKSRGSARLPSGYGRLLLM